MFKFIKIVFIIILTYACIHSFFFVAAEGWHTGKNNANDNCAAKKVMRSIKRY